jgi:MFS family permease
LLNASDHTARQRNASFGVTRIPPVLIALTAIGFAMFLSEGAIADWGGVYLRQSLQTDAIVAAAGYASFSAGMAIFRLLGDAITERLGAVNTLRVGALSAAAGLGIALASRSPMAALPGFALTGAGFSVIVPLVFGASGRVNEIPRGVAIALISGSGYIGFLFGPPLIGFIAQQTGLHEALCILIGLSVLAGALANAVRPTSDPTLIRERARLGAAGAPHDQFAVK